MAVATIISSMALVAVADAIENVQMPLVRMKDLPGIARPDDAQWLSMSKDVEFLPADSLPPSTNPIKRKRQLEEDNDGDEYNGSETGGWNAYNPYSVQPFVEGVGDYDEYQQAWRLLGFMIDCNAVPSEYEDQHGGSHSQDQGTTEEGCARYVIWAAYVDLYYEGGGIGEYQYWNRTTKSWDATSCQYAKGGGGGQNGGGDGSRCAKMDCHEEDTHFSLLGFFKHRSYDDWMEQLFKHEGMCVWTEEEYAFMKGARKAWPQGCTDSGSTTSGGDTIYYNIKPMPHGRIGVGLYLDKECIVDYSSATSMVEEVVGNMFTNVENSHDSGDDDNYDFSTESFSKSMARWNSAFDVWRMCHPCVAHDLENTSGDKYLDNDDYYSGNNYYYGNRRKLGGQYSAQGDVFECYDDAGYTNVNQCMKFSAKTAMETATFRDMSLARSQSSLVEYPLSGYLNSGGTYRREWVGNFVTYFFLMLTTIMLLYSFIYIYKATTETNYDLSGAVRDSLLVDKATDA